ncbi:MAG: serine/threonine-protein kinase [Polyangiales bacterium]
MTSTTTHSEAVSPWLREVARVPSAPEAAGLERGAQLLGGRFVVGRVLGSGGMGVVYDAWDRRARRHVALKTLSRTGPALLYRFKLEFRLLADVVHPNLVRMHLLFEDRGRLCMVMELLRGRTLGEIIADRPSVGALRELFAQIAEGVSAIHAAGCLHRDLKPDNIVVTRDGRVVITDYGLACAEALGAPGQTIFDGQGLGTPGYSAPEQSAGRTATRASDWYAFGVILHEALAAMRTAPSSEVRPTPHAPESSQLRLRRPAQHDLEDLCARLLDYEPERRPSEAAVRAVLRTASRAHPRATKVRGQLAIAGPASTDALRQLRKAYLCTDEDRVSIAWLIGPSGCGKTSVATRFLADLRDREDAIVLAGRCDPREFLPFRGLDALVDSLSRHLRTMTVERARTFLPPGLDALCELFPALGRINGLYDVREHARQPLSPRVTRARAAAALKALLARLAAHRPLVLYVEDAHHGDLESGRLLAQVLGPPAPPPLLVVACALPPSGHAGATTERGFMTALATVPGALQHTIDLPMHPLSKGERGIEKTVLSTPPSRPITEIPPVFDVSLRGRRGA